MQEYPLDTKEVKVNGTVVTLRELPTAFVDGVEKGVIKGTPRDVCAFGSDADDEVIAGMSNKQIVMMYEDIMQLSYGDNWRELVKQSATTQNSKKK